MSAAPAEWPAAAHDLLAGRPDLVGIGWTGTVLEAVCAA